MYNIKEKAEVNKLVEEIRDRFNRWNELSVKGCTDPFHCDGTNMNLVRNHIVYHQRELERLIQNNHLDYPIEYFYCAPVEVSHNYMAVPRKLVGDTK